MAVVNSTAGRRDALRRYPALVWLVAASLLALLLPSGLTVLQAGPPTLAEFAPVPGEGQGTSDVGELGQASSGGLGFGAGSGQGSVTTLPEEGSTAAGKVEYRPGTKRCVRHADGVVRQTEDPLSPPCIAFFEGNNFGATAKGVTGERITVVMESQVSGTGRRDTTADCGEPPSDDDVADLLICKAFQTYFNDRYQTYGRRVQMFFTNFEPAADMIERYNPFALVGLGGSSAAADKGVMAVGYTSQSRKSYQSKAPYLISFRPDVEDHTAMGASYVCSKLAGRPARYAGDATLQGQPRKFGLWYGDSETQQGHADLMLAELKSRCGIDIPPENRIRDIQPGEAPAAAGRLRANGVTTVLISMGNTSHSLATNYATQAGWFPEWVVPGRGDLRAIDTNFYGRLANQAQWANTIGVTVDYRRDGLGQQQWVRAYREGCPQCAQPTLASAGATLYDSMVMLFTGVQAAGPRLTAANIDKGLHAIPPNGSPNPYKPAAYFAPGNYTFVKDAMAVWWDPDGVPPGSSNQGCYRLPREGQRFRAGEWTAGDADVKAAGPCQGDTFG